MKLIEKMYHRVSASFLALSLRSKISIWLIAMVTVLLTLVMLASYANTYYLIREYSFTLQHSQAAFQKRELEIRLAAEISAAAELARNLTNADILQKAPDNPHAFPGNTHQQHHVIANAHLAVVDIQGRPLLSRDSQQRNDYREHPVFMAMIKTGSPQLQIHNDTVREAVLVNIFPVYDRAGKAIKGGVILEIPLQLLMESPPKTSARWITNEQGEVLAGRKPDAAERMSIKAALELPLPGAKLQYFVASDQVSVLDKLYQLLKMFALIILLAAALLWVVAKAISRYVSRPLEQLSNIAQEVTSAELTQSHIEIEAKDELGGLANAFNAMFSRLGFAYDDLEARVKTRTNELERTKNLLHEAVRSVTHGICIFDQQDMLIVFNEAYRQFTSLGEFIQPGRTYQDILAKLIETKSFVIPTSDAGNWEKAQMLMHQQADAMPFELQRQDGCYFMGQEVRSPSGFIISTRIEITELKNLTFTLAQRELYLSATLDNLPFMFWLKDKESRFLAVNKAFSTACGLSAPEEAIGKTDYDVWPKALAAQYHADDLEVIKSMKEKQVEEPMDGSYGATWIETYKKPVLNADGQVMGTVGFARDISDRKRTELALAEAELRWSMAMRGANDGIWDWNRQTNKVFYSERWKTMLGYTQEEITDSAEEWTTRIHPDDRDYMLGLINAHLAGKSEFYYGEHRLKCKDDSYKWILTRGKALFDDQGKAIRISGSHTDISEKKRAEDIILDRNQQLDAIFSLSADGFVSFDQHHCFKYANPAFYHLTGIEPSRLIGVNEDEFSRLLAAQCKDNAQFVGVRSLREKYAIESLSDPDKMQAPDTSQAPDKTQTKVQKREGQLIELADASNRLLEVSLRISKASTVSEILYVRDVTYEVEVSRIKSEFLSTAAHELRTPMSSIYGYSELLLTRAFSQEQQHNIFLVIHKQAALVSEILNELLDLQRIESRRGKDFVFALLSVQELVGEAVAMFKVPSDRTVPLVALADVQAFVRADRSKMIQVISNVLSNAYKYSSSGEVVIEVTSNESDQPHFIGIRIRDQGLGMAPEQLARVCERFYRVDTSGVVPGTGLGMSIVKEIIELHHGHVDIASQIGQGTTVTLWLPLAAMD